MKWYVVFDTFPVFHFFVKVMEAKSENVSFVTQKCQFRNVTDRYCHTFQNADFNCMTRNVNRQYLLNKVVCKDRKPVKFCRIIPE